MKHSIHLAAIALLTTLLVTSCDTFSAPADPDKNTEQVKGRIQVQATLSALKEMAGWTIYGGLICMIFVLVVPYPKRKLLT